MGNVHALAHRMTALSMACLASSGVILCALSGFSCSYVSLNAEPGRDLMTPGGDEYVGRTQEFLGVYCDSPFFEREIDENWKLSQIFFFTSLGTGGFTGLLAWALSTCVPPGKWTWRLLSFMAGVTAVMQIPVFLIFESESCNMDVSRQTCSMALGAYFNIASVAMWVILTLWSQLLDPPRWAEESGAWMSRPHEVKEIVIPSIGDPDTDEGTSHDQSHMTPSPTPMAPNPKEGGEILVITPDDQKGLALWTMDSAPEQDDCNSELSSVSENNTRSPLFGAKVSSSGDLECGRVRRSLQFDTVQEEAKTQDNTQRFSNRVRSIPKKDVDHKDPVHDEGCSGASKIFKNLKVKDVKSRSYCDMSSCAGPLFPSPLKDQMRVASALFDPENSYNSEEGTEQTPKAIRELNMLCPAVLTDNANNDVLCQEDETLERTISTKPEDAGKISDDAETKEKPPVWEFDMKPSRTFSADRATSEISYSVGNAAASVNGPSAQSILADLEAFQ